MSTRLRLLRFNSKLIRSIVNERVGVVVSWHVGGGSVSLVVVVILRVHGWRIGLVGLRILAILHRAEQQH